MKFLLSKLAPHVLRYVSFILFTGMLHSCQYKKRSSYINEEASFSLPGMPFSIEQGFFLNQYSNPSSRTTSWLLADSGFIHNQSLASFFSVSGKGKLCILHWSQTDDPVWIGARIPGRFLWADLIMYENDTLAIKQYKSNGMVAVANEAYKKDMEELLQEVNTVHYP